MDNYIEHHGILGMKWGVRRFQNPDGSLTEAGKRRYLDKNDPTKLTKQGKKFINSRESSSTKLYYSTNTYREYQKFLLEKKQVRSIISEEASIRAGLAKKYAEKDYAFRLASLKVNASGPDPEEVASAKKERDEVYDELKAHLSRTVQKIMDVAGDLPVENAFSVLLPYQEEAVRTVLINATDDALREYER